MEFSRDLREAVMSGDITVSFRLWRRPRVRQGGRYPAGPAHGERGRANRGFGRAELGVLRR
jgi:hypothetical protein